MKFYTSQLEQLLKAIEKGSLKAILLYGPDKGYISKICAAIVTKFNLSQTNVEYKDLKSGTLDLMLNSQNFFNQREFIRVSSTGSSIDKDLKPILLSDFMHFAAFIADELPPASSIRKFFETEGSLASIGCYNDDEQNIYKIIIQKCTEAKKNIDEDALIFLKTNLKGDAELVNSELDKLFAFADNLDRITLKDVEQIVSLSMSASGDEMCIYFAQKNLEKFLREVAKLQEQGINEVLIIRALIRYYINLYIVLSKAENGEQLELAIKSLTPPIFFKYLPDFRKTLEHLTAKDALHALSVLNRAELEFKTSPNTFDFYYSLFYPVWTTL